MFVGTAIRTTWNASTEGLEGLKGFYRRGLQGVKGKRGFRIFKNPSNPQGGTLVASQATMRAGRGRQSSAHDVTRRLAIWGFLVAQ